QSAAPVRVLKQWLQISGRTFLVESIDLPTLEPLFASLRTPKSTVAARAKRLDRLYAYRHAPSPRLVENSTNIIQMAKVDTPERPQRDRSLIWDYVTINTSQTNYQFTGDWTYLIAGNVTLSGTNTAFQSGAVIKYTNNVTLTVNTPISWQGTNYRPIVLVSKDDDSVGSPINGSTGSPGNNLYATSALTIGVTNSVALQNLRVANAQTAISFSGGSGHLISHAQLVNCQNGIAATSAEFSLRNALLHNVLTNFTGSSSTGRVEHMTVDTASWLNKDIGSNLFLTNCLLVAVTNSGSYSGNTVSNVTSPSGVFQVVGAGFHYLSNDTYRNRGTPSINGTLLSDLKEKTTYAPLVLTNTYSYCVILAPQAQRDTD